MKNAIDYTFTYYGNGAENLSDNGIRALFHLCTWIIVKHYNLRSNQVDLETELCLHIDQGKVDRYYFNQIKKFEEELGLTIYRTTITKTLKQACWINKNKKDVISGLKEIQTNKFRYNRWRVGKKIQKMDHLMLGSILSLQHLIKNLKVEGNYISFRTDTNPGTLLVRNLAIPGYDLVDELFFRLPEKTRRLCFFACLGKPHTKINTNLSTLAKFAGFNCKRKDNNIRYVNKALKRIQEIGKVKSFEREKEKYILITPPKTEVRAPETSKKTDS